MYGPDPQTFFDRLSQESIARVHGGPAGAPCRRAGGSQKAFFSELEGDILPVIHGDPGARLGREEVFGSLQVGREIVVIEEDGFPAMVAAAEFLACWPGVSPVKIPLFLFALHKDQRDTRDDRNSAHDRRQRDGLLLCSRDLEGSDINQLLLSCIAYTLIGQSQDS
jgi:hypothetical protein